MGVIRNTLVLVVLLLSTHLLVSQNIKIKEVTLNVSNTRMLTLNIGESKEYGIVKRTVEINKLFDKNNYTYRTNKCKISLKKRSNNSRRSVTPGKYELIVTYYVDGVIKKEIETFQVL